MASVAARFPREHIKWSPFICKTILHAKGSLPLLVFIYRPDWTWQLGSNTSLDICRNCFYYGRRRYISILVPALLATFGLRPYLSVLGLQLYYEIWYIMIDCSSSIANALELLQAFTKPSICCGDYRAFPFLNLGNLEQCCFIDEDIVQSLIAQRDVITSYAVSTLAGDGVASFCARSSANKMMAMFNTLRPRQNGRHFTDGIFKGIFMNETLWIF